MNLNISLKQLVIFYKIVANASIVVAAQELHLTPSAVSRSLQTLEEHLGTQLINRTTRNLSTTQAGLDLFQALTMILPDLDSVLENIISSKREPIGELNITCSIAFASSHLMKIFAKYRQQYPKVRLNVHLADQLENLNEGKYDLALRIVRQAPDNYAMRKLADIDWVYCASPHYLAQYGRPASIDHICRYPHVQNPSINSLVTQPLADKSGGNNLTVQANSGAVLLEAALNGLGIAYLPTYMLGDHLEKGDLVQLFDKNPLQNHHQLYALYLPNKFINKKIRTFIDFIYHELNPIPPWDQRGEASQSE